MPVKWKKVWVADECYESCGVFDVNNDGVPDIVSGAWWYQGPDYKKKHFIGKVRAEGEYYDDFSTIPLDVNGDGWLDFITGGWWGDTLRWRENPGAKGGEWPEHVIAETGNIETTRAWDIDGDGQVEIIPNTPGARNVKVFKLRRDTQGKGTGKFDTFVIHEFSEGQNQGHGLGCGNIAGNGRMDVLLNKGWLEAPKNQLKDKWIWHPDFDLGCGSVPMLVMDVNGDGLHDLIVGQAHPFGLDWWEQKLVSGKRSWIKHPIDPFNAQYHDLQWADIDGDGQCELVTGKRHRAHCGNEPGEFDDYGIYYFKWNGESFSKQVIDYGPLGEAKGCGIFFALADLRGTGRLDLVAPGKDGLVIFYNEGA
ncbi:MAG: VCBS repeat-containing protein [Verrucomicrobia bacterium]|nr:VCBS repeat-containing protein [Verrucomicrobiota bacterium]MCG2679994.1 VCBS repeat-containing protein [Kiritimatiellia bacterium]MBU4247379.1 VCBS repeat-containing protein [Verrucomicrobiota bacterium]MBU4290628.1 VCBS repeat-containing protein [Verrucomicrobiota bacterium]MBU4429211.1 VCBS repeat-containing protein [Verrucomicrobiota bacterium]